MTRLLFLPSVVKLYYFSIFLFISVQKYYKCFESIMKLGSPGEEERVRDEVHPDRSVVQVKEKLEQNGGGSAVHE